MVAESKFVPKIPSETSQAAHGLYNLQYIYLRIGDQLEDLISRIDVRKLDPGVRIDDMTCFRLALATAFQFAESLPDEMAAEATLRRMDWKYALYLPVHHPGISSQDLCEFRQSLLSSPASQREFGNLLSVLDKLGLFSYAPQPEYALALLCQLSRLYQLRQAMKEALTLLVVEAPEWLLANASPHWYGRYQSEEANQSNFISNDTLHKEINKIGKDIYHLVTAINRHGSQALADLTEIQRLNQLLASSFEINGNLVKWLTPSCANCVRRMSGVNRNYRSRNYDL